jgi:hypothetical protein
MPQVVDPRTIITPDSFHVAPELLGRPLARPWRRLVAMLIDLLLIAILANAGGVFFGFAAAFVLWRLSSRKASGSWLAQSWRTAMRVVAAVLLFVVALSLWGTASRRVARIGRGSGRATTEARLSGDASSPEGVQLSGAEGVATAAELLRLRQAKSEADARAAVASLVARLSAAGVEPDGIRDVVQGVARSTDRAWVTAVADSAVRALGEPAAAPHTAAEADSLATAWAAALEAGDTVRAQQLRAELVPLLAADTTARLERRIDRLREERKTLRTQLEEAEQSPGVMRLLRTLADDLGLGFGWSGLYFTAFLALWRGQTPGKRLLGLRVVRLDGAPMTWWAAFERFGGYAASIFTGLLGFAQIIWDRNRQGMHDKIVETVVVQLPGRSAS